MTDEADAGNGLKTESKRAILINAAGAVAATAVLGYLETIDVSGLPGWAVPAAILAISTVTGWVTAYKTKNV